MQAIASLQAPATALAIQSTIAAPVAVRYATINQAAKLHPAFTPSAFRDIRFKSADRINSRGEIIKGNGSDDFGVWVSIGRKILIDLDAFDRWIESHKKARQ